MNTRNQRCFLVLNFHWNRRFYKTTEKWTISFLCFDNWFAGIDDATFIPAIPSLLIFPFHRTPTNRLATPATWCFSLCPLRVFPLMIVRSTSVLNTVFLHRHSPNELACFDFISSLLALYTMHLPFPFFFRSLTSVHNFLLIIPIHRSFHYRVFRISNTYLHTYVLSSCLQIQTNFIRISTIIRHWNVFMR